jgi:hypothetical protein
MYHMATLDYSFGFGAHVAKGINAATAAFRDLQRLDNRQILVSKRSDGV